MRSSSFSWDGEQWRQLLDAGPAAFVSRVAACDGGLIAAHLRFGTPASTTLTLFDGTTWRPVVEDAPIWADRLTVGNDGLYIGLGDTVPNARPAFALWRY